MKILAECYITLLRKRQRRPGLGERTGEAQNPGAPQSQRCPTGPGPEPGMHRPPPTPAGSFKANTSPALRRRRALLPEVEGQALPAHSTARKGQCRRGTRDPGRGGLTFPTGTKAAAVSTRGGSDSAPRDRRDYASQNPDGSRDTDGGPCSGSYPTSVPGLHLPEFRGHFVAFLGRKCRLLSRVCGLDFPACGSDGIP